MKYFKDCKNVDEAKNLFKKLCLKLHPDTSGYDSQSEFIKMFNEFKNFKINDNDDDIDAEKFYNIVKKFDSLFNVKISFVGSFIWIEDIEKGATYLQKEILKQIKIDGYNDIKFAPKKKCWYFSPLDYKRKGNYEISIEEIKSKYGAKEFNNKINLVTN